LVRSGSSVVFASLAAPTTLSANPASSFPACAADWITRMNAAIP
jgi:hypothetical protein